MSRIAACMKVCALLAIPVLLVSCGSGTGPKPTNQKKTIPVKGQVFVDGKPTAGVRIDLHPKAPDAGNPTSTWGMTGEDGSFTLTTYGTGDGAPPGEYTMTFKWADLGFGLGNRDEEKVQDKLQGKYSDPKTAKEPLNVKEDDVEVDKGRIDLKTGA